jgi:hypothetical protein
MVRLFALVLVMVLLMGLPSVSTAQTVIVERPPMVVYAPPPAVVAPAPVAVTTYRPAVLPWRRVAVTTYAAPAPAPVVTYAAPAVRVIARPRVVRYYTPYYYP